MVPKGGAPVTQLRIEQCGLVREALHYRLVCHRAPEARKPRDANGEAKEPAAMANASLGR